MNQDYYSNQQPPKQSGSRNNPLLIVIAVLLVMAIISAMTLTFTLFANNGALPSESSAGSSVVFGDSSTNTAESGTGIKSNTSGTSETSGSAIKAPEATHSDGDFTLETVSSGEALSVKEIVKLTAASVVEITTESVTTSSFFGQYITDGAGSGVIIDESGLIVTNNHVIEDATTITVRLNDGTVYNATLIGTDSDEDLAVIKIDATGLTKCVFGDSDKLEAGDSVVAIGNPLGTLGGTVTNGIVSATGRQITVDGNTMTLLQTNAALSPGNSGGGLFNEAGELIGIVNAKSTGEYAEGLGFAIPTSHAVKIIEDLVNYGYVRGKVELGATFVDVYNNNYLRYYRLSEYGTYVYSVTNGSDASEAGLKSGDLIVSVNGIEVTGESVINEILASASVGDKLTVVYKRSGSTQTAEVTLTEHIPG